MADGKGEMLLAPAATDGVHIRATDSTALNLDINVVVAKWLWLKLVLVELEPSLGSIDLEAGKLLGIRHLRSWEQGSCTTSEGTTRDVRVMLRKGADFKSNPLSERQLVFIAKRQE